VGSGQWAVGSGQWAVGSGQWAVKIRADPESSLPTALLTDLSSFFHNVE
jgi:hypothetical protein